MAFVSALDLGKQQDPTALAVLDQRPITRPVGRRRWEYECVHLETWPLGTRYTDIVTDVRARFDTKVLRYTKLAYDHSGVGNAVGEYLRAAKVPARVVPILITGGHAVTRDEESRAYHVPKIEVVGALQIVLHAELLKIDPRLKLAARVKRELEKFRIKVTAAKNETYAAEGSNTDDLVMALAMAVWLAEREGPGDVSGISLPEPGRGSEIEAAPAGVFDTPSAYHHGGGFDDRR